MTNKTVESMGLLIWLHNPDHLAEFETWVETYPGGPYTGGRTAFFTSDGAQYDLGGPNLVFLTPAPEEIKKEDDTDE